MLDFHEKRKMRGYIYSKISIGLIFIIATLIALSVYERLVVEREMAGKRLEKEKELYELQQRAAILETNVEYLKNNRGLEEAIRGRFDVAKEGEQVIIIIDDTENGESGVDAGN